MPPLHALITRSSTPRHLVFTLLGCLCLLLLAGGCQAADPETEIQPPDTWFPLTLNGVTLHVQLALTSQERQRGLMHRESLPEDHGMLFVFPAPESRSFYMRNTTIPRDLGSFDADGRLLERHALYPLDETPVPSRSDAIQFALEMNQGWFRRQEITTGVQLDLEEIRTAIQKRGEDPNDWNLALQR